MSSDVARELLRIEEDAKHSSKGHFESASIWRRLNYWLGIPAAVGAGVASVAAFNSYTIASGVVALIVAALTAVTTFLDPSARASSHQASGANFLALRNQARILREVGLAREPETAWDKFQKLAEQRDSLNAESPAISWLAYRRAKAGIERGEALHAIDRGHE